MLEFAVDALELSKLPVLRDIISEQTSAGDRKTAVIAAPCHPGWPWLTVIVQATIAVAGWPWVTVMMPAAFAIVHILAFLYTATLPLRYGDDGVAPHETLSYRRRLLAVSTLWLVSCYFALAVWHFSEGPSSR